MSVDDYYMRLKKLVDELRDLGEKVSDELLLSMLIAGLNDDFGNAASNIPLITNPTFPKIVAYLKLEEQRMLMSRTGDPHRPHCQYPWRCAAHRPARQALHGPLIHLLCRCTHGAFRRSGPLARSSRSSQHHHPSSYSSEFCIHV